MPRFRYKAVDDTGHVFKGEQVAFDDGDLERDLSRTGLSLIHCRKSGGAGLQGWLHGGVKPRILAEFYYRFAQTLEIGLPVLSGLEENARYLPSRAMGKIVAEIKVSVEGGRALHEAMARHPKVFPKLDISIVRMGEQTGVLPESLQRLASFTEWKEDLRSSIRKAVVYPAFIGTSIFGVIAVWVGYVLPQMVGVLSEMDAAVPGVTLAVLSVSDFVKSHWAAILVSGLVFVAGFWIYQKTARGALVVHRRLLRLPFLGEVILNVALARLCHNFSTMLNAGMTIPYIFESLSDHALGNRHLEARLKRVFRDVESGNSIAAGFERTGGFPSLLLGAVRNGEETGTLDAAFGRLGKYFDGEVKRTVQTLVNAIEPMTILLLGGVFGLIVLSILLPLYDVMGSMGNAY